MTKINISANTEDSTGKNVVIDVIDIARIENGRIAEHWGIPDRFTLLMQLGILQRAAGHPERKLPDETRPGMDN
ncbi:MAG: ester cyclase [Bacteroidota bacterium]